MSNNKIPQYDNATVEKLASHIKSIIEILGEDPTREGLVKTPQRAAKALIDNTSGYNQDPARLIKQALFTHVGDEMVIVKDIEFYSLCEHHVLTFFGTISIGYLPDGDGNYARGTGVCRSAEREIYPSALQPDHSE